MRPTMNDLRQRARVAQRDAPIVCETTSQARARLGQIDDEISEHERDIDDILCSISRLEDERHELEQQIEEAEQAQPEEAELERIARPRAGEPLLFREVAA